MGASCSNIWLLPGGAEVMNSRGIVLLYVNISCFPVPRNVYFLFQFVFLVLFFSILTRFEWGWVLWTIQFQWATPRVRAEETTLIWFRNNYHVCGFFLKIDWIEILKKNTHRNNTIMQCYNISTIVALFSGFVLNDRSSPQLFLNPTAAPRRPTPPTSSPPLQRK